MCGRYSLAAPAGRIQAVFGLPALPELLPRFNVAPGSRVPAILADVYGSKLEWFRWGLIPSWAKDKKIGYRALNARAEGIEKKPMFRSAFKRRHCLVPMDGFYEWTRAGKSKKQPWHIRIPETEVFAVAGLWETWRDPETDEELQSVTLITTTPNDFMKPIHNRMPVILPESSWRTWLDTDNVAPEEHSGLLVPYVREMTARRVCTYVNKAGNEGPRCHEPPGDDPHDD